MKYIIDEKELRELLYSYYKLEALEYGGVDNWEYYSESQEDYLDFVFSGSDADYMFNNEGLEFLVNDEIKKYKPFHPGFDYTERCVNNEESLD